MNLIHEIVSHGQMRVITSMKSYFVASVLMQRDISDLKLRMRKEVTIAENGAAAGLVLDLVQRYSREKRIVLGRELWVSLGNMDSTLW